VERSGKPEASNDAPRPIGKDLIWGFLIQIAVIGALLLSLILILR